MRRRIGRAIDIWYLGRMAERALCDPHEEVYLKRENPLTNELWLRVDGAWRVSPASARLLHRVWARAES
jgi:hypothetical protein